MIVYSLPCVLFTVLYLPHRGEVARSIAHLCSMSMTTNKSLGGTPYWEWLLAIPLLHQLQAPDGTQVDDLYIDTDKPDWGWNGLDRTNLREFRNYVQSKK